MIQVRVPPVGEILARWPEIAPLLKRATDRTEGCYEPEDVLGFVYNGKSTILLIEEPGPSELAPPGLLVVAVVELRHYPRKRVLDVSFLGGRPGNDTGLREWVPALVAKLEDMARECGAALISGSGRIGWARAAKFKLVGGYMTKRVA